MSWNHTQQAKVVAAGRRCRRGSVLVYSLYMMLLMCAVISVAVDYGRMQVIKTQMQRAADVTARAAMKKYLLNGRSMSGVATWATSSVAALQQVDAGSGIAPTVTIQTGYWKNSAFVAGSSTVYPRAVKVLISRSVANNNPVPLAFPLPSGNGSLLTRTVDVWAKSVAILPNAVTLSQTVQATYDPWLAGMPNGTNNTSYDDTAGANALNGQPMSPVALNVTPGSTLTISGSVTGTVTHDKPNNLTPTGPQGDLSSADSQQYWHMKDPPSGKAAVGSGAQSNIGDVITPINSLVGVFLDNNAPSAANAPTTVRDYSSQAARDNASFADLQLQQPFYIGDGTNTAGTVQTFVVPSKATRLFLGPMDGYEWKNNDGSFSVTFTMQPPIQTVE